MQCSLYGKLPTKRDFIAIGTPRNFLDVWEPWLQGGVSASRSTLKDEWQNAFLTAPIWRFWIGAELCGTSVIGAFMPSLDGVGRYFPLTLFACADENAAIPPPEFNTQDQWFDSAEELLMSTLDHHKSFDAVMSDLEGLAAPFQEFPNSAAQDTIVQSDGTIAIARNETQFSDLFNSVRNAEYNRIYASMTCWWTVGGEGFAPMALCGNHMPDPFLFSRMLTGKFASVQS